MTKRPDRQVTKKLIALPDSTWQAIEDYRARMELVSNTEAVRRLIGEALATHGLPRRKTRRRAKDE